MTLYNDFLNLTIFFSRMCTFNETEFKKSFQKADYVSQRLPDGLASVGTEAKINNYWLFPIIVVSIIDVYCSIVLPSISK